MKAEVKVLALIALSVAWIVFGDRAPSDTGEKTATPGLLSVQAWINSTNTTNASVNNSAPQSPLPTLGSFVKGTVHIDYVEIGQKTDGDLASNEKPQWKPDWNASKISGEIKTWLPKEEESKAVTSKILGATPLDFFDPEGKVSSFHALLKGSGEVYCVHPSLYQKSVLPFRPKYEDTDKLSGQFTIEIEPIKDTSEVIRAQGSLPFLAAISGPPTVGFRGIDASAVFLPGLKWKVKQSMILLINQDGKTLKVTLEPGEYQLDEKSVPRPLAR